MEFAMFMQASISANAMVLISLIIMVKARWSLTMLNAFLCLLTSAAVVVYSSDPFTAMQNGDTIIVFTVFASIMLVIATLMMLSPRERKHRKELKANGWLGKRDLMFSLKGQVNQARFWQVTAIQVAIAAAYVALFAVMVNMHILAQMFVGMLTIVCAAVIYLSVIANAAKRWRDAGKSPWLATLSAIPLFGQTVMVLVTGLYRNTSEQV